MMSVNPNIIDENYIHEHALRLVELARYAGVVVTIETKPKKPLAMGNHFMVVHVRSTRERYARNLK